MHRYFDIGFIQLPAYGVMMAAGFVAAGTAASLRARKRGGQWDMVVLIAAVTLLTALAGAAILYYVASYGVARLVREVLSGDFGFIRQGGLVFYGGLIAAVPAAFLTMKLNRLDYSLYTEAIVPAIPLGHAFGRIGCTLGGCCYGVPYHGPLAVWSLEYTDAQGGHPALFPVQPMEAALLLALFGLLCLYTRRRDKGVRTLFVYLIGYAAVRAFTECFRGDLIRGGFLGVSTSQWISAAMALIGVAGLAYLRGRARRAAA